MASFAYTARDQSGAACSGTLTGQSVAEISARLRAEGKYPISVRPAGAAPVGVVGEGSVAGIRAPRSEVIQIATQLAIMTDTGVTLTDALESIAAQAQRPEVKKLVDDLYAQVHNGTDFSAALARHPRSFPRLFIALIKASEKSGMLTKLLLRGAHYLRDEQETLRKVKGALTYPAIMLSFAFTATIFLLAFVLPRFTAIYASKGAALPLPTRLLMGASNAITTHWMMLLAGSVVAVIGLLFYLRSAHGRRSRDYVQLNLPLFGGLFRELYLARSLRMVGTMGQAGVNLLDCVATARDLCENSYYRDLWDLAGQQIQIGKQLSEPLFRSPLVPRPVAQMIHSGERGGKLAAVMEQVAGYGEQELKERIAAMTRYIEPAMILVMGLLIGGIALAMLLPIFSISKVVAQ